MRTAGRPDSPSRAEGGRRVARSGRRTVSPTCNSASAPIGSPGGLRSRAGNRGPAVRRVTRQSGASDRTVVVLSGEGASGERSRSASDCGRRADRRCTFGVLARAQRGLPGVRARRKNRLRRARALLRRRRGWACPPHRLAQNTERVRPSSRGRIRAPKEAAARAASRPSRPASAHLGLLRELLAHAAAPSPPGIRLPSCRLPPTERAEKATDKTEVTETNVETNVPHLKGNIFSAGKARTVLRAGVGEVDCYEPERGSSAATGGHQLERRLSVSQPAVVAPAS